MKLTTYLPLFLLYSLLTPSFAAQVKSVQNKGAMADEALTKALQPSWEDVTYDRRLVLINGYGKQCLEKLLPQDVIRIIAQYCKIAWQWRAISSGHLLDVDSKLGTTHMNCQFIEPDTMMYRERDSIHTLHLDEDSEQLKAYVKVLTKNHFGNVASLYLAGTPTSVLSLGTRNNACVLYTHEMNKGKLGEAKLYKTYRSDGDYGIENLGPNLVVMFSKDDPKHHFTLFYKRGYEVVYRDYTSSATRAEEIRYKAFHLSKNYLFLTFFSQQKQYYYVWRCELKKLLLGRCIWKKKYFQPEWSEKIYFMTYGDGLYCINGYTLFRIDHTSSKKEILPVPIVFSNFCIPKAVPLQGGFWLCTYYNKAYRGDDKYRTAVCKIGDNDTLEAVNVNGTGYFLVAYGFYRAMIKYKSSKTIVCQMLAFD